MRLVMKAATATRTTLGRPRQDRGTAIRTWSDPERTRRDAIGHSIGLKLLPTLITSPGMSAGRGQRRTINLRTAAAGAPPSGQVPTRTTLAQLDQPRPHRLWGCGDRERSVHDDVGIRQQFVAWHRCVHLGTQGRTWSKSMVPVYRVLGTAICPAPALGEPRLLMPGHRLSPRSRATPPTVIAATGLQG